MEIKNKNLLPSSSPEELMEVLQKLASGWGDIVDDQESLEIIPFKGAMTNEVYQINWPTKNGDERRKVLVRVYGKGVENFFTRDDEIRTFEFMSRHGQGPLLLSHFTGGRVEEFIPSRTLSAADLHNLDISALIAAKMREFHNLEVQGSKDVLLWDRMRTWLSEAKSFYKDENSEEFQLDTLEDEISMLERKLTCDDQEIGFCHNDLQYGNIMMDERTNAITIIDYEYASYNPVAYDLANHFCEMAANYHSDTPHILDYNLYPELEARRSFVHAYLGSSENTPSEEEVEKLLSDAEKYALASHILWGLWGLISEKVNKIEFDYKEYARQRFRQYWLTKPSLLGSSEDSSG